jgi:hypothetical protein
MPSAPLARTCVLLALFAATASSSQSTSKSHLAPDPPKCTPGPPPSPIASPSEADVQCAVRWHSWCASQVEAFNAYARARVSGTHVGLYSNTLWKAAAQRMREAGCGKRPEWMVPHHPDAWHGLGTASYGAWGRGLHSSTSQLHMSTFEGYSGCFHEVPLTKMAQDELGSGRV